LLISSLFRFDSSVGRGNFVTAIGIGNVIKGNDPSIPHEAPGPGIIEHTTGWDEGVTTMKLGEKATLDITK
jgi:FK506-binding protein 1